MCQKGFTLTHVKKEYLAVAKKTLKFGASIHNSAGVEFGKAVMDNSSINIGLYPSEKIGKNSIHFVCKATDYDLLITDEHVSEDFLTQAQELGIPVTVVNL